MLFWEYQAKSHKASIGAKRKKRKGIHANYFMKEGAVESQWEKC